MINSFKYNLFIGISPFTTVQLRNSCGFISFTLHTAYKNVPCSIIVWSYFNRTMFAVGRMSVRCWWQSPSLRQLSLGIGMWKFHSNSSFVRCPNKCPVLCLTADISSGFTTVLKDGWWGTRQKRHLNSIRKKTNNQFFLRFSEGDIIFSSRQQNDG
jgi:hypothetical protein